MLIKTRTLLAYSSRGGSNLSILNLWTFDRATQFENA